MGIQFKTCFLMQMQTCFLKVVENCIVLRIWALFLFLGFYSYLGAQVSISYPVAAQTIQKGMSSSFLTVKIDFSTTCTSVLAEIRMPPNTEYIPGSLDSIAGNLRIAEQSIGNLRKPVFSITNSSSNTSITFRMRRRVICASHTIGKDSVYVTNSCGATTENAGNINTYSLVQPVLSFASIPTMQNGLLGKVFTRNIQVINGGQGCIDTFRFYLINSNKQLNYATQLKFNNVAFSPVRTRGDTMFYKIFGSTIFGGTNVLCNGGKVVVTEEFKIEKCTGRVQYAAFWGPNDTKTCNSTFAVANIAMANGVGSFSSMAVNLASNYVDMCGSNSGGFVEYTARYNWTGNGNDTAAGAYSIGIDLGNFSNNSNLTPLPSTIFTELDSVKINGVLIPSVFQNGILSLQLKDYFTSDPDGAGGLMDLDGDGFFDDLKRGDFLLFTFKVKLNCDLQCNVNKITSFSGNMHYARMCDTTTISSGRVNSNRTLDERQWIANGYIQSNITPGQSFRVRLSASAIGNNNYFRTNQTRFVWELVLPKGFSVSGNGNVSWYNGFYYGTPNPVSRNYVQSNDTVRITSPSSAPGWVEINLVYNCDTFYLSQFDLNYRLLQVNNISTNCNCMGQMVCDKLTTRAYCDEGCAKGPVTGIPVIKRSKYSVGWTNNSLTTRQDRNAISSYDLSKALYLDTIEIYSNAIQQDSSRNLKLRFELPKAASNTNKLTPLDVQYFFYRNDSLIRSGLDSAFTMANSSNTLQVIDWDLINLIPNGQLLPLDSIVTVTRYVVSTNVLPNFDVQSGGDWYYYGIDLRTYDLKFCNKRTAEMYLVGTSRLNATNAYNVSGCNTTALGGFSNYLARRFASSGTKYNNEFRPTILIDSVQLTVPSGYQFDLVNYIHTASFGNTRYTLNNVLPDKVNGNILTFYNKGRFAPLDLTVTNTYGGLFQVLVTPKCETKSPEAIVTAVFAKDYVYKFGLDSVYPTAFSGNILGATRNIFHFNKGAIRLVNNNLNKLSTKKTEKLSYRIANNSNGNTKYLWGKVASNSTIKVDSVFLLNPRRKLVIDTLSDGIWFKVDSNGIQPGQFLDVELYTNFSACNADSVKVYGGWDCHEFTHNPNENFCGLDSVWLKVVPDVSEIQLSFLNPAKAKFTLCNLDTLSLEFNNANASYVYNPSIIVEVPPGISFPDSALIEYPANSSNLFKIPVSIVNGKATLNLFLHPLIANNGIPGLVDATSLSLRNPKIHLPFSIDCNFVSGMSLKANAYAFSPCGDEVLGFGYIAQSRGIDLEGISFAGEVKLEAKVNKSVLKCGEELIVQTKITPYFFKFNQGDTFVYTVSKLIVPSDSFFKKLGSCASCSYSLGENNNQDWVVKITMDTSVAIDTFLEFNLHFKPYLGDTGVVLVEGYFKRNVAPLLCGSNYCENTSVILAKFNTTQIQITKPPSFASFVVQTYDSCARSNQFVLQNTSSSFSRFNSSYYWDFGDSSFTTGVGPLTKSYQSEGFYNIRMILDNPNGCRDTAFTSVRIFPNPNATFTTNDTGQCLINNYFDFTNLSSIADSTSLTFEWDIAQIDTSTSFSVNYSFPSTGFFKTGLVATSTRGCTDTFNQNLQVFEMPNASFLLNDSMQCLRGNLFEFENNSSIGAQDSLFVSWDFGNGDSSSQYKVDYQYVKEGKFDIRLAVISENGCVDTAIGNVEVLPMPMSVFQVDSNAQCLLGNKFGFVNSSTISDNSDLYYTWDLDASGISQAFEPVVTYTNHGTYNIVLIAVSEAACADTFSKNIVVLPMPIALFNVNQLGQCEKGNTFVFENKSLSVNGFLEYNWNFDDGNTSDIINPTHSFKQVGTYAVSHEVVSDDNCRDTFVLNVNVYPMPQADFIIDNPSQCLQNNIFVFQNQSTIADSVGIVESKWFYGNGDSSSMQSPSYSYSQFGEYEVSAMVFSIHNCSDTTQRLLSVKPMPVAQFSVIDTGFCLLGNKFEFVNKSFIADTSIALVYNWNFGDLASSSLVNSSHSYLNDSSYLVSLFVSSVDACADSAFQMVYVYPMPQSSFIQNDSGLCLKNNVFTFLNTSQIKYGDLQFRWEFGDSDLGFLENETKSYANYGVFNPMLIAISNNNCADTSVGFLEVFPMPQAQFTTLDSAICFRNNLFTFSNLSQLAYGSFTSNWKFGDEDSSQLLHPTFSFSQTGRHEVRLEIESENQCKDTFMRNVWVYDMPVSEFNVVLNEQCLLGNKFEFNNLSTIQTGEKLDWYWQFGDGQTATTMHPVVSYTSEGEFNVLLISNSMNGCADSFMYNTYVYPMPKAVFSVLDSMLCQTESFFDFTNLSEISNGSIVSYVWDFGNSDTMHTFKPIYKYDSLGEYLVRLFVTSDRQCKDTAFAVMGVYDNPKAIMQVDSVCVGEQTNLRSLSTSIDGAITQYTWHVNNLLGPNLSSFSTLLNKEGSYNVRLIVESEYGCKDTLFKENIAVVYPLPKADFTFTKVKDSLYYTSILMQNKSKGNALEYSWQVSDGQQFYDENPFILLRDTGLVMVILKIVDEHQCEHETEVEFLNYPRNYAYVPTAFSPNFDLINNEFKMEGVVYALQFKMEIFDRWGSKIFETNNLNEGWDGTYKGNIVPDGVYTYKIRYLNLQKEFVRKVGTVTLLR